MNEKTRKVMRPATEVYDEIEEHFMLLHGLSDIIRSQIDLFALDNRDMSSVQIEDLINRHVMLGDALTHVAICIDKAVDALGDIELYEDKKLYSVKEGKVV